MCIRDRYYVIHVTVNSQIATVQRFGNVRLNLIYYDSLIRLISWSECIITTFKNVQSNCESATYKTDSCINLELKYELTSCQESLGFVYCKPTSLFSLPLMYTKVYWIVMYLTAACTVRLY